MGNFNGAEIMSFISFIVSVGTLVGVFTKIEHRFTKLETMQNIMTKILLDDLNKKGPK